MKYYFFILLILFMSCSIPNQRQKILNRVNNEITKEAERKLGLQTYGMGVRGPVAIHALNYSFNYDAYVNLSDARKLIVNVIRVITSIATKDKELELELNNPPFTEDHVAASIRISPNKLNLLEKNPIAFVAFSKNNINYYKNNPITERYEVIYRETLAEALTHLEEN